MDINLSKKKLKIVDGAFSHCEYSNNPVPPTQICPYLYWDRTFPMNSNETLFVTENNVMNPSVFSLPVKKVAWFIECREYAPMNYSWISKNYNKYDYFLTHDREMLKTIPNSLWLPSSGCWIFEKDWSLNYEKNKLVSMMISEKKQLTGHALRHRVKNEIGGIDIFGRGHKQINNKIEALKEYKFSLVIENSMIPGYFTEKIIDAFVTGTIPIYWGDPKINEVFDVNGMIIVKSFDEIKKVLETLESVDTIKFEEGLKNNFEEAKKYTLPENYLYNNYKFLIQ